jgi:hypothetical protein
VDWVAGRYVPYGRPARAGSPPWVSPSRREPRHVPHGHHAPVQHGGLRKPLLTHGHLLPSLPSTDSLPTPSLDERRQLRRQQMGGGGSSGRYMELAPGVSRLESIKQIEPSQSQRANKVEAEPSETRSQELCQSPRQASDPLDAHAAFIERGSAREGIWGPSAPIFFPGHQLDGREQNVRDASLHGGVRS